MTRVVVTGYASLDHVAVLAGAPVAGATTRILHRPAQAWPRLGGSPAYVARALVAGGVAGAMPLSWVGADQGGAAWRAALTACGVPDDGIVTVAGARTPLAVMAYQPDGACVCLYDPGLPDPADLSPLQAALLAAADWVCLTVGPPAVTDAVLDRIPAAARVVWAVKHDPRALSAAQARRLMQRADLVCFSRAEATFAAAAGPPRAGALRVETHGRDGATLRWDGGEATLPAPVLRVHDPTGAGDTLVGGMIAALIAAPDDPVAALRAGIAAAADLLRCRARQEEP